MKVLLHYAAGPALRAQLVTLRERGLEVVVCPEGPEEPFATQLRDAEAIWHSLQPITAAMIEAAPRLRLIQKIGVGLNTIDLDAARARGVAVCNMPGTNSRAVAEMTLLLMLAALRRLRGAEQTLRSGGWMPEQDTREAFGELCGRTVGIVGFGAVPQLLAPILAAMGARIAYTATAPKAVPWQFLALDALLEQADIVTLHVPLTAATTRMLDRERIARMKPGAILVNTARGGLVDEPALVEALASGRLGGAGLDVFAQEPLHEASPLLRLPNVTLTPHIAWLTAETWQRSIGIATHNTLAIRDGTPLVHRVV